MTRILNKDHFETQKHIMAGTWDYWTEEKKREHIRILVREAHKTRAEWDERLIMVYDE